MHPMAAADSSSSETSSTMKLFLKRRVGRQYSLQHHQAPKCILRQQQTAAVKLAQALNLSSNKGCGCIAVFSTTRRPNASCGSSKQQQQSRAETCAVAGMRRRQRHFQQQQALKRVLWHQTSAAVISPNMLTMYNENDRMVAPSSGSTRY